MANRKHKKIQWEGIWSLGKQSNTYFQGEYRGLHCEVHYNNHLGHSETMVWDWSFYDHKSYDPDLAIARDSKPTREEATEELMDYIDGYMPTRRSYNAKANR